MVAPTMGGGADFDADADINALLADNLVDLVRFAYFITGNRDLADDVTAEAIERVLPHWRAGTVDDPMAYLRRAVVNTASNRHRRRKREDRGDSVVILELRPPASHEDLVAHRDEMWQALRRLSVEHRAIVVLRYYDDLSEEAIADVLGVSVGTVKSRSHRALKHLRRVIARARRENG